MPAPPPRAAVVVCALVPVAACGLLGDHPGARRRPVPPPSPVMTRSETKQVLARYALRLNLANRQLSPQLATVALTGSALELQAAKYKIAEVNRVRLAPHRYGAALSARPKFGTYPRWFFAALTDRGTRPVTREISVFVQDGPGAQWRAAYSPTTVAPVTGPLATGVAFAGSPDVPPQDDTTLVVPPSRLPGAVVDLLNRGRRSRYHRVVRTAPWIGGARAILGQVHAVHLRDGWRGSAAFAPAAYPAYAIRTTSGGALVWAAVDLRESHRRDRTGTGFTWRSGMWGDLLRPFIGHSAANRSLAIGVRFEFAAYVPPRGKGRVRFLADRWFPYSVAGR